MLNICIGFDPREAVAYHVLCHSILRRASGPVSITPLNLHNLWGCYSRPRDPLQSTDFAFSRFLTPYLTGFKGQSIFMDCDMLCLGDVYELAEYARNDPYADVYVVQHDYQPKTASKFLGAKQTAYPKKNWSSVMVFNGHRTPVRRLTPGYVNEATGMELHQFHWAVQVGALPPEWNHLVGEYAPNPQAKLVHFTLGGPYFPEYANCEYAEQWRNEWLSMVHAGPLDCQAEPAIIQPSNIGVGYGQETQAETDQAQAPAPTVSSR
jgi:hypothetical protein